MSFRSTSRSSDSAPDVGVVAAELGVDGVIESLLQRVGECSGAGGDSLKSDRLSVR